MENEEIPIITLPNGKQFKRKKYSKYTKDELIEIIKLCDNYVHIIETLRINKYYHKYLKRFVQEHKIDISHFKSSEKTIVPFKDRLTKDSKKLHSSDIKEYLVKNNIVKYGCSDCKVGNMWRDKPLSLQLVHINGDHYDNRIENLRLMCPNCHSQTDTYTGRNLRKYETKKCSSCDKQVKTESSTLKCADCIAKDKMKCTVCLEKPRHSNWSKCKECMNIKLPEKMCKGCNEPITRFTNKTDYHKKCMKHSAMKKGETTNE